MLNNLAGWHILIVLAVLVVLAVSVVLIVVVARRVGRSRSDGAVTPEPDPEAGFQTLAGLRERGLISESEYEAKRHELLGRI